MEQHEVAEVLAEPLSRELLSSSIPARLAYVGLDGAPRVIPVAFLRDGANVVIGTVPGSAKVRSLAARPPGRGHRRHPGAVAAAGAADPWRGAPGDRRRGTGGVRRGVPEGTPDWAKLLDFETTIPEAVENLLRERTGQ